MDTEKYVRRQIGLKEAHFSTQAPAWKYTFYNLKKFKYQLKLTSKALHSIHYNILSRHNKFIKNVSIKTVAVEFSKLWSVSKEVRRTRGYHGNTTSTHDRSGSSPDAGHDPHVRIVAGILVRPVVRQRHAQFLCFLQPLAVMQFADWGRLHALHDDGLAWPFSEVIWLIDC